MTHSYSNKHNQRGEVAWLLTVVSMVVIGFGLVIGFNISTQEQAAIRLAPQAQTLVSGSLGTTPTPEADSKQPTNHHNICFVKKDGKNVAPGTGANLFDKLCEANFLPLKISVDSKGDPSVRARASQNVAENPTYLANQSRIITTPSLDYTNISVSGALCVKNNVNFDPADLVNTDVYASAVAADPEAPTTIATQVKAYKIAGTSGPERDSSQRNFLKMANESQEVCTYNFDITTPAQPTNPTNPILMKLYLNKGEVGKVDATLLGQIERARKAGKWDAAQCSIYIHADTNPDEAIDVYNIAKLDLRKFLTGAEVDQLCPPNTPTPPQVTPTVPVTPTVTPIPLACSQSCTAASACGSYLDPITGKEELLGCLDSSTNYVDLCSDSEFGGRTACQCAPMKCVGPKGLCSPEELACGKTTPTKKLPPPPVTPTVIPQAMQCTYNALAFVEECLDVNEVTGKCELKGARKNAKAFAANILDPNPQNADRSDKWGASNNLQRKNAEPGGLRAAGMIPATIFSYFDGNKVASGLRARFFNFPFNTTQGADGGVAYEPISAIDVDSSQDVETKAKTLKEQVKELTSPRSDIKIEHLSELPTQNTNMYIAEQYTNFSNADVRLDYDDVNYRILPDGKQVYSCTNTLIAQVDPNDKRAKGVGSCLPQPTSSPTDADRRDTISGLTVGCGQNIVYGWTLQKCNFDFDIVLVVDTSSSMTFDKNGTQRRKIDIAKDQLKEFIDFAQANYGPKTRIALVSFNAAESYSPTGGTTDNGKGKISDFVALKTSDTQTNVSGIATLKASIDSLQTVEGTCIQCGLKNAQSYLQKRSQPELRLPVLVLLSDGRPNSFPGAKTDNPVRGQVEPNPGDELNEIYRLADEIRADGVTTKTDDSRSINNNKTVVDDTLFVAFGYGDSKLAVDNNDALLFSLLNSVVSFRRDSQRAFDISERWIYTTDRGTDADEIQVQTVVSQIKTDLNTCSQLSLAYDNVQKAKDVNTDGIVNTIDLFLVFDNYFAKGQNLKEDINGDGVVNINDVTLIVESLGTVVTPADKAVTGAEQPTQ